jgi:2-polyprenyl-3-methyl-5-hydroxy-6-metoxy-1,4-benzoquinol methylase
MSRSFRDRIYGSYYSDTYSSVNRPTDDAYRMHARILRELLLPHLPARRDAEVLDAACGIGYALHALREAGFTRVRGIDLSAEQVEIARARGLPVERADLFEHLRDRRACYDAVIALDLIEHLDREELLRFFDLVRECLRPDGRLIAKTANANSLLASRFRYLDFTHEMIFTERSLRAALRASGLEPVWIGGERYTPFTAGGWLRRAAAGVGRALWRAYLVAELGREGVDIPLEFCLIAVARRT